MAIFITGATGFIGKKLAQRLASQGEVVHVLARDPKKAADLTHANIKVFKGDILEPESLAAAIKGCDQVYHVASFVDIWSKDPATPFVVNVEGTVNVLQACENEGVKKVVVTSTAGVFGPSHGPEVDEDSVRRTDFFFRYETSKFMAEEKVQHFARKGMNVVIVNPTRVFGPGEMSKSNSWVMLIAMLVNKGITFIPGKGNKSGNYVFVDDVLEGHILAMEKGERGEKYILGGENATMNELLQMVREESGRKGVVIRMPLFILFSIAKLQDWKANIFKRPPLITTPFTKRYMVNWANSNKKAKEKLGFQPLSLREGIRKTVEWIRQMEAEKKNKK